MRKEHSIRISVPDLFRSYIYVFAVGIYIKEKLSGIKYFIYCLYGMFSSFYREKGNCIQDKKERTCYPEKISHHKVSSPSCLKLRKTVKNIESIFSFTVYNIMNLHGEVFKSVCQGNFDSFYFRTFIDERSMTGKTKIDNVPFIFYSLSDIGFHEKFEFCQVGNSPYDIVTQTYVIKSHIHFRYTAFYSVKCCHILLLSIIA